MNCVATEDLLLSHIIRRHKQWKNGGGGYHQ